jgi:hypothetical protein
VLQLLADDGDLQASDTVQIAVNPAGGGGATLAKVNFQPGGSEIPSGYVADSGAAFDLARGYGWAPGTWWITFSESNRYADQRLDTNVYSQGAISTWEHVVPGSGTYLVTFTCGHPDYDKTQWVELEGVVVLNQVVPAGTFVTLTDQPVHVADGRLTLRLGNGSTMEYIDIIAPPVPGDANGDGDVDLDDYAALPNCVTDPGGTVGAECEWADLDGDGDCDLADFAIFAAVFTGP